MWLTHLKIGTKQGLGFGLVLVLLASVNFKSLQSLRTLKEELDEVSGNWLPRVIAISELNLNTSELRRLQLSHAYTKQIDVRQVHADSMIILIDRINENRDTYEDLRADSERRGLYTEDEQDRYRVFDETWGDYQDLGFEVYALTEAGQSEAAINMLDGEAQRIYDQLRTQLEDLVGLTQLRARNSALAAEQTYRRSYAVSLALLVFSILLSALITTGLVRHITSRVAELQVAARRVSRGDLNVRNEVKYRDEIGFLARSFNQMTSSLKDYRDKTEQQAAELYGKQEALRQSNLNLAEQSRSLERQKMEIVRKNIDLQGALEQLRTTQEQLITSAKMASLGDLVAGVAHEINNPINFVSSNVQPLRRDIADIMAMLSEYETLLLDAKSDGKSELVDDLKERYELEMVAGEIEQLLSGIQEGADRTAAIVRGLRNFSRMDEDKLHQFDINDGIESTLLILHNEIKQRIEIVKEFGEIPPIMGYPGKLNQVFMNLLSNAVHAIDGKGQIFLSTRCEDSEVIVTFRDTGSGIPDEIKNRIFEPFFTTKEVGRGTGLGLSISYGIIEDHRGRIELDSRAGEGTEFRIYLPLKV